MTKLSTNEIRNQYKESINLYLSSVKYLRKINILEKQAVGLLVDMMVLKGYTLKNEWWHGLTSSTSFSFVSCNDSDSMPDDYFLCNYALLEKDGKRYMIGGGSWQIFEGISISTRPLKGESKEVARFTFDLYDTDRNVHLFNEQLDKSMINF